MTRELDVQELRELLGPPETEKTMLSPTLALREDRFACGCVRLVKMGGVPGQKLDCDVTFEPCDEHSELDEAKVL